MPATQIASIISLIWQRSSTSKDHGQASSIKYMNAVLDNFYIVVIDGKVNSSTCGKFVMCFDVIICFMKLCDLFEILYM